MKISKLFHWLYAFLMFLPIVLFIPNAFYYGFNEHATNSETTTINYKYQSNEVNNVDDLVLGNIYKFNTNEILIKDIISEQGHDGYIAFELLTDLKFTSTLLMDDVLSYNISFVPSTTIVTFDNHTYLSLYEEYNSLDDYYITFDTDTNTMLSDCIIKLIYFNDIDISFLTYTDYNVIESVETNTNDTISNKMYQAWQSTWNLPLLQWTHTSFVAQPFTYITGLFGVPSDSTLNYIFAYFVSISICWLVFDLLMYVPNLAHRWLDKGALD